MQTVFLLCLNLDLLLYSIGSSSVKKVKGLALFLRLKPCYLLKAARFVNEYFVLLFAEVKESFGDWTFVDNALPVSNLPDFLWLSVI